MGTRNFPQQGVVITPESDEFEAGLSFNADKSTISGKLIIVDLPATHGRSGFNWDFEGVMTVGEWTSEDETVYIGFADGSVEIPAFGLLTGFSSVIVFALYEEPVVAIIWGNGETTTVDKIEINGVLFENGVQGGVTIFLTETNPFPAVGQTCTIKIKKGYLVAPNR
jgi:hypothetical protein